TEAEAARRACHMSRVSQDDLNQQGKIGIEMRQVSTSDGDTSQDWEMTGHGGYEEDTGWAETAIHTIKAPIS
ncbi:hypothetical protein ACQP3L_36015, partial [Escherichia coli]